MPDGTGPAAASSTGFIHELARSADGSWINWDARVVSRREPPPRTGRPSVRRTTSITSSTYWSASPCSAAVRTQPPTWSSSTRIDRASTAARSGGGLLEDVDAVLLALDHPRDPANLALHPRQATDQLGLVLGVAVPEVARVRRGAAPCARRSDSSVRGPPRAVTRARGAPAPRSNHTPRGVSWPTAIGTPARDRAPVDWRPMDRRDRTARLPTAWPHRLRHDSRSTAPSARRFASTVIAGR